MKEYIGITGYKYEDEINEALRTYAAAGIAEESDIGTMFGFLISAKQTQDATFEGRRFPSLNSLSSLLRMVPVRAMPTIHYCSYAKNLDVDNLSRILDYKDIAENTQAIQLNLDWPAAENIAKVKERFPHLYIIQQLNPTLLGVDIVKKVMEYEGVVDKLLIDPSLGAGISYDIAQTSIIINQIADKTDRFSYVVCGGLDAKNVFNKIIDAKYFVKPAFSIDAEGRLRTEDDSRLNMDECNAYIMNAARAMNMPTEKNYRR